MLWYAMNTVFNTFLHIRISRITYITIPSETGMAGCINNGDSPHEVLLKKMLDNN